MRKINFLLAGLATLFMASCSNDEPANNGGGDNGKGGNESYLAIKISNPGSPMSRIAEDGDKYETGTQTESTISDIVFYLLNEDGSAFTLYNGADGTETGSNKVEPTSISGTYPHPDKDNIDATYNPVIVFTHKVGEIPTRIVAIANAKAKLADEKYKTLSESQIKDVLEDFTDGFVMSNAMTANNKFTKITPENLSANVDAAKANPITINVERLKARVDVDLQSGAQNGYYEIKDAQIDGAPLYAKLDAWGLQFVASKSYLLKNVDFTTNAASLTSPAPWTGWSTDLRSFWANTTNVPIENNNISWGNLNPTRTSDYVTENTNETTPTTLVVRAKIYKKVGDNYEDVTVTQFNGVRYAGEAALKTAMADFLKGQQQAYRAYIKTGENSYQTIPSAAINLKVDDNNKYQVVPILNTKDYPDIYKVEGPENNPTSATLLTEEQVNTLFKNVIGYAMSWGAGENNSMTYYHYAIKHEIEGAPAGTTGIVRNHVYKINIKSVGGLGTPVYDPDQVIIPEEVEFEESSMYAEISVLSWRVVSQDVNLGQ